VRLSGFVPKQGFLNKKIF